MPIIAFIGVRISRLIVAGKSALLSGLRGYHPALAQVRCSCGCQLAGGLCERILRSPFGW